MQEIIMQADTRIPNQVSEAQKLLWLSELEGRICWDLKKDYAEYTFTVGADGAYTLPGPEEQVEWVFYNGKNIPKPYCYTKKGDYRVLYRALPQSADTTTLPSGHPCFGIYEEYLCMQLAKHLCDTERYRLAESAFNRLWTELTLHFKQTAPQTPLKVRGL